MGSDRAASVTSPYSEVHDTKDLYVMDGSCFPNASLVNSAISVSTIARRAATFAGGGSPAMSVCRRKLC